MEHPLSVDVFFDLMEALWVNPVLGFANHALAVDDAFEPLLQSEDVASLTVLDLQFQLLLALHQVLEVHLQPILLFVIREICLE